MAKSLSPLRYPGGKTKIYEKVKRLIISNGYEDRTYVEPFSGGFGIGIALLCEDVVKAAILNDYDSHIYHFWYSVLHDTENLLRLINDTPVTVEEREHQKANYNNVNTDSLLDGFATLFLNRVNFSGVIKGGPIGGLAQTGAYKIDCRFNKKEICNKVQVIANLKSKIKLYNKDAATLIKMNLIKIKTPMFLNIDPPYVIKGSKLYTNFFTDADHLNLECVIARYLDDRFPWIVTYDDCALIRELYKQFYMQEYQIAYNVGSVALGKEIVITNLLPENFSW